MGHTGVGGGGNGQCGVETGTDSAMSLFSEIEKTIERGFRRWTERMFGPAESGELLMVHRAILEEIESKVQIIARGRRVFPFGRVMVTLVAADEERRTLLQAAFGERLGNDVREMLDGAGCETPRGFAVEVGTAAAGLGAFQIEYAVEAPKQVPEWTPSHGRRAAWCRSKARRSTRSTGWIARARTWAAFRN